MQKTPLKASRKIDQVIGRLNSSWDLQIPHLHGSEAQRAENSTELARKCSSRIRALCWKDNVNIDGVLEDFEERAAQTHSKWVFKPSQEPGTLPSLPVSKSFLKRDAISRPHQSPKERNSLLKLLADLLDEEYKLAKASADYSRTSFTPQESTSAAHSFSSSRTSPSRSSYSTARDWDETRVSQKHEKMTEAKKHTATSNKRGAAHLQPGASKKTKVDPESGQLSLAQAFQRSSERRSAQSRNALASSDLHQQWTSSRLHPGSEATFESNFASITSSEDEPCPFSSNDTSIVSDWAGRESHFSGGSQLDLDFHHDPKLNSSFRKADGSNKSAIELLNNLRQDNPFTGDTSQYLPDAPYWYNFELYRLSLHLKCKVSKLTYEMTTICGSAIPNFGMFWKEAVRMCRNAHLSTPQKSGMKAWTYEDDRYNDPVSGRSVYFSARLDFSRTPNQQLFDLKLNPVDIDKSCRLHRKYGADRFLVLDIPTFAPEHPKDLPATLRQSRKPQEIHDIVFEWLTGGNLHLAGRIWRVFFVEPKSIPKKKRKEQGTRHKVYLFAIDGLEFASARSSSLKSGHIPVSLVDFVNWHIPLLKNLESADLKLFARMHLGLSKTTPTVVLDQSEFIKIPDKVGRDSEGSEIEGAEIMTDGCARISYPLAVAIWESMTKHTEPLPSVFQARISGAKGLWIVDYEKSHSDREDRIGRGWWIEISDSQLKIKPHPCDRDDADAEQRTFEVVKTSHPCSSAALNNQLITILEHQGVTRDCLKEVMLAELSEYYESLKEALHDPVDLRRWRQAWHPARSTFFEMRWCGEMPDRREDELDMLLEAGFDPRSCHYLVGELLHSLVSRNIQDRKEKMWIRIPHSTNVFCIPDPTGLLQEGEVQINFSQPVSDFPDSELEGLEALVARNPAHLLSDIQKVKFVHHQELRYWKDVIIFPIQGKQSLAGMLSGGDYDGDTITVIWAQMITQLFQNAAVPKLPSEADCGIRSEMQLLGSTFTHDPPEARQLDQFISKCCSFNGYASRLGETTKLLEKLVYADSSNILTEEAHKLAALAGYLVDGPKQGNTFPTEVWTKLKSQIVKKFQLNRLPDNLPYDDENAVRSASFGESCNVLDYLKFDVAERKSEQILQEFSRDLVPQPRKDRDLAFFYDDAWDKANRLKGSEKDNYKEFLNHLRTQVAKVHEQWQVKLGPHAAMKNRQHARRDAELADYGKIMEELSEEIVHIKPLNSSNFFGLAFEEQGGAKGSVWSLFKASCVYSEYWKNKMPWKLVGEELCHLKALALRKNGVRVRPTTQAVRDYMKFDTKKRPQLFRSCQDAEVDDDEDEVEIED